MSDNHLHNYEIAMAVIGLGQRGGMLVGQLAESGIPEVKYLVVQADMQAHPHIVVVHPHDATSEGVRHFVFGTNVVMLVADVRDEAHGRMVSTIAQGARANGALVILIEPTVPDALGVQCRAAVDVYLTLSSAGDQVHVVRDLLQSMMAMASDGLVMIVFDDIHEMLKNAGELFVLMHVGSGVHRVRHMAETITQWAVRKPRLRQATRAIMRVVGNDDLTIRDVSDVASAVEAMVHPQASMLWSMDITPEMPFGQMRVTALITKCEV